MQNKISQTQKEIEKAFFSLEEKGFIELSLAKEYPTLAYKIKKLKAFNPSALDK